ncbi:MAG: hypothetical protein HY720_21410 [Planctomycetes bacterium]|nr:hypothetical protein [Planctomycetota bacterium]
MIRRTTLFLALLLAFGSLLAGCHGTSVYVHGGHGAFYYSGQGHHPHGAPHHW